MADSPDVLSMGRRCVQLGYSFHWPAGSMEPFLVRPDGVHVKLAVRDYLPFLVTKDEVDGSEAKLFTCPAPPGDGIPDAGGSASEHESEEARKVEAKSLRHVLLHDKVADLATDYLSVYPVPSKTSEHVFNGSPA